LNAVKRVAILDLGSNTARLVLFEYQEGLRYALVDELREVVRLSEGMGEDNIIRAEAFERGLEALGTFRAYCDAAGVGEVCATATSAVRDAVNGEAFLRAARERAGLSLRILSGEEEAEYGALAVANSSTLEDGFVLDIGGGSAQLSRLERRHFQEGRSWPLGAVRLSEAFLKSDPPKKKEVRALVKHVQKALAGGLEGFGEGRSLVGMGGTIRNLAKVQQKREGYPVDLLHGYVLKREALEEITDELLQKSAAERAEVPGLSADRADIIPAGALALREVMALAGVDGLTISAQGLREGLFYPYLLGEEPFLLVGVRAFSVRNLERHYYDNAPHNAHVCKLSLSLFDQLTGLHGHGPFERGLLEAAAHLHDVGMAVSYNDHHKHGFYLVMSSALPGYSHREQALIALLVRYHRKGTPGDGGLGGVLEAGDPARVEKLGALLRLAEYLERSKAQRVRDVRLHVAEGYMQLQALGEGIQVEVGEARARKDLFEKAYGVTLEVMAAG